MRSSKKLISIVLSVCMLFSVMAVGTAVSAEAADTYETYAQDTTQGSVILHCFDWSYNNIKAALPDIARAGYTAVQTSPVQSPKDYNPSWTDAPNQWWKLYQPLGFSVSDNTWLGTKAQLTSLCTEADKYGIKVIVDIVANHLANNGTDGGTFSYINSGVEGDLKNANYYHTNNIKTNDDSRHNITQYHLGMPDLNTGNTYVQQRALGLLEECIDCGVDGFRFDAAKHIELPADASNIRSNFWPTVINGAKSYAENNEKAEPFFYGEILGSAGPNFDISNYTTYMAVTDNQTGDRALDKAYWNAASELADGSYMKGASADKSVLWVESHDTYMGNSGSAWTGNTKDVTSDVINKAWAIVGARADSTALFFARPNNTMGAASTDTNWKSTEVAEVNKFKNHFAGTNEYLASSGNTAYIERGNKGVVISKLDGGGAVNLTANQMQSGTYTDQVTGNTFTVANGKITGTVGSSGVAVVYNADDTAYNRITASTLYLKTGTHDEWPSSGYYAMYVFNNSTNDWVSMTDSNSDGIYEANVPDGNWTGVIFCKMNNSSLGWDNKNIQTKNLLPVGDENQFTVTGGGQSSNYTGTWSVYGSPEPTSAPTTVAPTTEASSDTYTIYAVDNAGWNTNNMYVYYWNDGPGWPGNAMTSVSGTKVFKCEIPKNVTGLLFNIGSNSKQTVDITSGIKDGAVFTISSSKDNSGKYLVDEFYLVGSMNSWTNNDSYVFSYDSYDNNKLTFKLSGVQLSSGNEFKVHSTNSDNGGSDSWYPSGNNHTVSDEGTYDIYFRPNGDSDSDNTWLSDSNNNSKRYVKLVNVTPCTITWKDGDDNILKTESVPRGTTPSYSGETPTKSPTERYVYTFNNTWSPAITAVTADATYTAQFDQSDRTFTVTWKNYDGTVLETDENVSYGAAPSYDGATPVRAAEGSTNYTFSGWSPQITNETTVTDDVTYIARFSTNTQTYTITWKDGDGNTIKTETCIEGVTPHYMGETPTKTATAQYTYTFNNSWSPAPVAADRDAIYTAQFDSTVNEYDVTWKDGNGDVLKTEQVPFGTTPEYDGETPTKNSDASYNYTFNNTWSPAIVPVNGEATYTAQFDATPIPNYTIYATNVVDWDDVYVYYWTDFGNNSWPGTKMTADADNFIMTAQIPSNAKGIVFNDGASQNVKQTVNIESGISDGAHWAILDEKDETETSKYKVHAVPTYYLVGTPTNWSSEGAPVFAPHKAETKVEEYKLTASLSANDQIKVFGSNDAWFPSGENNNYSVTAAGTYEVYFRPNGDGGSTWHANYFKLKNVTPYTVTWKDYDGTVLKTDTVLYGETPAYGAADPSREATAEATYTFTGWSPTPSAATADAIYTAQYSSTSNYYTVTWVDDNDEVLETDSNVPYGTTPTFDGTIPTKAATAQYTYTFDKWSPDVVAVTEDVIYKATYTATVNKYTIKFVNADGTELQNTQVEYGETPAYTGQTPVMEATAQYTYTFDKWSPDVVAVAADAIYTATYTSTVNSYTVTWVNYDDTELEKDVNVPFGDTPSYDGVTPTKPADLEHTYTFAGWYPATASVSGDVTYKATFTSADAGTFGITVTNAIGWDKMYVYYWLGDSNNGWPGVEMTADADGFNYTANIPATVEGVIFTDGASKNAQQTANIETGIADGAHWVVCNHNDNVTVKPVPTYYLVGTMTQWQTDDAPTFTAVKNSDGLEEYKLTATLSANDQIKVYGSNDAWFPSGENNNYKITGDGTYEIYFRPNYDGNNDWHESVFYVNNITEYTITWVNEGETIKTETLHYGETPSYSGSDPAKAPDLQYSYTFTGWTPAITAVTENATYTASYSSQAHTWTLDSWTWTGYESAVAHFVCGDCDFTATADATVTSASDTLKTVYTATATFNGAEYTDTKTVYFDGFGAALAGHSISLDGDIGVNFFMELSPEIASSQTAYMLFTVPTGTQTVYVKDAKHANIGNKTYYVFKCYVAAKEMTYRIGSQMFDGDNSGKVYEYSVKDYADWLLAHTDDSAEYAKAAPLVKAMLNYGAAAQLYFSKGATPEEKLANYDLLADDKAINVDTIPQAEEAFSLPDGVVFEGATLSLKSETTLSLYFSGLTDPTFSCNGKTVETVENGSYWVARIRNISANELQDTFTVTFDGGSATYCPMNYCSNALSSSNEYLQNVAKALYLYSEAAKEFF